MTRVILLAGPSGSGKTRLARACRALVVRLDDFYRDADAPDLPRTPHGFIDWDDVATWDAAGAVAALKHLVTEGHAEMPVYSITDSRRIGWRRLDLDGEQLVIAEGIFAIELLAHARADGLEVEPLYLDRSRTLVAALRFRRDVAQHRKPLPVLVRRGLDLWHAQPGLRRRAVAAGFAPVTMRAGVRGLAARG